MPEKMRKVSIFMCLSAIAVLAIAFEIFDTRPKSLKIERLVGKCRKYPKAPIEFKDVVIVPSSRGFGIKGKIVVKEPIGDNLNLKFLLKRCQNRGALDTCEDMPPLTMSKLCLEWKSDRTFFAPVMKTLRPPLYCPFQPGTYVTTNGSLDVQYLNTIPMDGVYWFSEVHFLDGDHNNKVVMCLTGEWHIVVMKPQ